MREKWEFEDAYDTIRLIAKNRFLRNLRIKWFDPTQSYEASVTDKGLLEGLMLKKVRCTLYLAQESETLGKDSELAATLAQGKPVIAYVPKILATETGAFARKLRTRSLEYFLKGLLILRTERFFDSYDSVVEAAKRFTKLARVSAFHPAQDWLTFMFEFR